MKRRHLLGAPACLLLPGLPALAADKMDPALRSRAVRSVAMGLHYLRGQQAPDGSVLKSVGITALSLRAFLESHRGYNEGDGAFITNQVAFILAKARNGPEIAADCLAHLRRYLEMLLPLPEQKG